MRKANKKMQTTKSSIHHSGSNSLNKQIYSRSSQITANTSTTKRVNDISKNKASNKNVLEMIYDDEFVIMINQLSTSIKNYYRANNKNFSTIRNILNKNEMLNYNDDNDLMIETFSKIENTFSFFYSSAKQIFKNMKIYRREKIANILAHNKKKLNNKNDDEEDKSDEKNEENNEDKNDDKDEESNNDKVDDEEDENDNENEEDNDEEEEKADE